MVKVTPSDKILKIGLMRLIGGCIDEQSLIDDVDTFVEMDEAIIHFAGVGVDRYFRVTLTDATEDEYFKRYDGS